MRYNGVYLLMKVDNTMKIISSFIALSLLAGVAPSNAVANVIFQDDFESADFSHPKYPDSVFTWSGTNRTSIVRNDQYVVFNGQRVNIGPLSRGWDAISGRHAMRFRYPTNVPQSEQRFKLGQAYKELWFSYWIRVPLNYQYTNINGGAANNKFFSLWMDGYEGKGSGSTFWLSMEKNGSNADLAFTSSRGGYSGSIAYQQHKPFINSATDKGKWMHIIFHVKTSSPNGARNGIIETFRRWQDETAYTKLHSADNVDFNTPASASLPQGFQAGYVFGWANGYYAVDTEWLIDDFTISTSPPLLPALPSPPVQNIPVCLGC